jgi:hypothetical protein
MRTILALLLLTVSAFAEVQKLYMTDGTYQLVREWKKDGDRIKFYSTERSEWEEVPLNLVDVRKTEAESVVRKSALDEGARMAAEEDQAVKEQHDDILKIPQDPGVYVLNDSKQLQIFKLADVKVHNNKGRSILKIAIPMPIVPGKATMELDGEHSANIVHQDRQEFFLQLEKQETFAIIRLTPHRNVRIAEQIDIAPLVKEMSEEVQEVPSFKKQLTESGLYKIWPEKPMTEGEYAVIEYTPGKVEPRIWDFQFKK